MEGTERMEGRSNAARIVWGLLLIAAGILFMAKQLELVAGSVLWRFWPLGIVALGLHRILQFQGGESIPGGLYLLAVGSWLLVVNLGLFGLSVGNSWPVLVIAAGIWLIGGALRSHGAAGVAKEVGHEQ
jgi:hypothetical protein